MTPSTVRVRKEQREAPALKVLERLGVCSDCGALCFGRTGRCQRCMFGPLSRKRVKEIRSRLSAGEGLSSVARSMRISRQRVHQLANPDKHAARIALGNAVRAGDIEKPDACEKCSCQGARIEGHHDNYDHPLDVRWLCPPCHSVEHPHHHRNDKGKSA